MSYQANNLPPQREAILPNIAVALAVGIFAAIVNFAFSRLFDSHRPVEPDATFYLAIAKQLAREFSYTDPSNFWPDTPSVGRSPLWPFMTSLAIRLLPSVDPNALIRYAALSVNVLTAMIISLLGMRATGSRRVGFLTGVLYAIYPTALWDAELGLSEISFLLFAAAGSLLILDRADINSRPRAAGILLGAFLLGLACLSRPNFVLFLPLWFGLLILRRLRTREQLEYPVVPMLLAAAIFYLPTAGWVYRNYTVTGKFGVISSIRGETFYGAHNERTFYDLSQFGYWVFPDEIPGESPKRVLATQFNEVELDDYYFQRGVQYLKTHVEDFPRLVLGKLIRAYVPVPWVFDWKSWAASLFRIFILVTALLCVHRWARLSSSGYRDLLWAMILCNTAMVVVFYGCARFALLVEPFLLPFSAAFVLEIPRRFQQWRRPSSGGFPV